MNEGSQKTLLLFSCILFIIQPLLAYDEVKAPYFFSQSPNKEVSSLNDCIEFLNEAVYVTRWLQQGLVAYNMHANYYHGVNLGSSEHSGNLSISIEQFEAPKALYQNTLKSLDNLSISDRDKLKPKITEIETLIEEMGSLYDSLKLYIDTQSYRQDNLAQSQQHLKRFEELFSSLDTSIQASFQIIQSIYSQYEEKPASTLQDKTYTHLFSMLTASQNLLQEVKKNFYTPAQNGHVRLLALTDSLEKYVYSIPSVSYRSKPSAAEKRLMDKISTSTQALVDKTSGLSVDLLDDQFTFERIIYHFNQSSVYFNMLIDLGGEKQLFFPHHPFLYKYVRPSEIPMVLPDPSNLPLLADTISLENFAPSHLVFLLDISKSMNDPHKLPLLKQSLTKLIPILRSVDTVSLITFSGKADVILPPTSLIKPDRVIASLDSLKPSGSTQLLSGLNMAYKIARTHFIPEGNNRIILATDGLFSIDSKTLKRVRNFSNDDIHLSVFNFGTNQNAIDKLVKLADRGRGNYKAISTDNADQNLLKELMSKPKQN